MCSSIKAPSVLLLLFGLLDSTGSLPPPRTSFLLNSTRRPLLLFSHPDVLNVTTLLLSDDKSTLYVGARNTLLSLDVSQSDVINLKKKVDWSPSQAEINECQRKGKNSVDCRNFVHVLLPVNATLLYACGSYAFGPGEVFIDVESFSVVHSGSAKGRCPFSPFQRAAAIAADGELFTATTTTFRGDTPQISRHFSKNGRPDVSQDSSVLLEEPTFVSSISDPTDRKLYFFFTETGTEFSFVEDLQIARVAQVCKDDVGGKRTLQKKWTSFAKASLLCQLPKQLPFNVLQDVFTLQPPEGGGDPLLYGVFTSQWSSGPESAVCVFKMQDVRTVFSGTYRVLDMQTHHWRPVLEKHSYLGKCGLDNASDSDLAEVKRSFLTSASVKPVGDAPLVVSSEQRYVRVAAMTTPAANSKLYTVLFLLTESGFLHKVVLFERGARIIEEIQVFTQTQQVKSIIISPSKGVVYVGTSQGVTAVPVARCSIHRSCRQCVLARDPLCGWIRTRRVCAGLDGGHENMVQDLEDADGEECQEEAGPGVDTEVSVRLFEAVTLSCPRPSDVASLTWTSPRFQNLPQKRFIQSTDGSLTFFATADTFGTYRCEATEGGRKEVIVSYAVRQMAAPRSTSPRADPDRGSQDESFEDIFTQKPETSPAPPTGDSEEDKSETKGYESTPNSEHETKPISETDGRSEAGDLDFMTTSRGDPFSKEQRRELSEEPRRPTGRSYYPELLTVALLLAICMCVLVLGGLHMWRQGRTHLRKSPPVGSEDGCKTHQSMESVPSLSSPDGPEVKVAD